MNTSIAIDEIIAGREHGSHEQPTHYRYIFTFFGIYGRPAGKVIPVAAVVRLLAELDCEPSSVRSSISRLKSKGVLVSSKTASGNGYALSESLEPHMQVGDDRIFSPRPIGISDSWLLVSFSVPESERKNRHMLRVGLARIGFGIVGPGLYIGPARLEADVVEYIREHQLWEYVELFVCQPSGLGDQGTSADDLRQATRPSRSDSSPGSPLMCAPKWRGEQPSNWKAHAVLVDCPKVTHPMDALGSVGIHDGRIRQVSIERRSR